MAVTGVFTADFSNFDSAVQKSTANLAGLEGGTAKVDAQLKLLTQSQEQLLNKIGASGGRIQDLGDASSETAGQVGSLTAQYRQFDGLLQAAGINIGPQIKGLEDLAATAGKTASQLGALGTAGAIVGTAITAWNFGKWIGEVTGATEAVEYLTTRLLGLESVTEQTAAAQRDVFNQAFELGGRNLRTYAEAVEFVNHKMAENAAKGINWREVLAATHKELRGMTEERKTEIGIAIEAGATTEQLTLKYGLSAEALALLKTQTDASTAAAERHREAREKEAAALEKSYAKLMSDVKNANQLAIMEADAANMTAVATQKKLEAGSGWMKLMTDSAKVTSDATAAATAYATEQDALTAANDALWQSVEQTGEAHLEAGAAAEQGTQQAVQGYQAVAQQVEITSDGVKGWLELMRATNAANSLLNQNSLFTTGSTLENQARIGGAFSPIPGFARGVENFEGGLARVHGGEVLANLPRGTSVYPKGSGLGGANVSNVFNLVDTESNLAKRVAELIMRQIRAGTQLGQA